MIMFKINIKRLLSASTHHHLIVLMSLTFIVLATLDVQAQPSGLDDDPGSSVPVDGGLSLLIGAGVVYGVKRLKGRNVSGRGSFKSRRVL
jgi:hypothetical protein